jgi:hypothetical protein
MVWHLKSSTFFFMKRAVPLDQYSHLYVRKTTPRLDWDWAGRHGGWLDVDDPARLCLLARLWAGRSLCRRMADIEIAFRRNVYTSQRIQALKKNYLGLHNEIRPVRLRLSNWV